MGPVNMLTVYAMLARIIRFITPVLFISDVRVSSVNNHLYPVIVGNLIFILPKYDNTNKKIYILGTYHDYNERN